MWLKLLILIFVTANFSVNSNQNINIRQFECALKGRYGGPLKHGQDKWCFFEKLFIEPQEKVNFNAIDVNVETIDKVRFRECLITEIPSNLFETFVNLETLNMEKIHLQEINSNSFQNATKLRSLSLRNNEIRFLWKKSFYGAKSLAYLDLSNNEIFEIDEKTFEGADFVMELMLSENKLKNLHKDTFKNLKYLDHLALDGNQLKILPQELFENNFLITSLNLQGNYLNGIPSTLFSHMKQLFDLKMTGNKCIDENFINAHLKVNEVILALMQCHRNYEMEKLDSILEKNQGMIGILHSYIRKVDQTLSEIEAQLNLVVGVILKASNSNDSVEASNLDRQNNEV